MSRIRQKKPARNPHELAEISAYRKRPAEKADRSQASLPHALTGATEANDAGNSGADASRAHALGGAGTPNGAPAPPAGNAY